MLKLRHNRIRPKLFGIADASFIPKKDHRFIISGSDRCRSQQKDPPDEQLLRGIVAIVVVVVASSSSLKFGNALPIARFRAVTCHFWNEDDEYDISA